MTVASSWSTRPRAKSGRWLSHPSRARDLVPNEVHGVQAGETRPSKTTVVLQRGSATVVINDVPAQVCGNCGEEYVGEQVAESVLAGAEASARAGVRVEIRDYVAA